MPYWLDDLLTALVVLSVLTFVFGFFRFVFSSGKRKSGLKISGISVVSFVVAGIAIGVVSDASFERSGFESEEDFREAASFGVHDVTVWNEQKEDLLRAKAQEEDALRMKAEEARVAEEQKKRSGLHCLSGWDGSHAFFKRAVRDAMRNPSSFEHIQTRVTKANDAGWHTLLMEYRAENGFGGVNVAVAVGEFETDDCANFRVLKVE